MNIQYEITFANIDKDKTREKLKSVGAELVSPEFLQQRLNFDLPKSIREGRKWIRLRTNGERTTLTYKSLNPKEGISGQREVKFEVSSFDAAKEFMQLSGAILKNEQHNKREVWNYNGVEIMINEWPFIEPYLDIEGINEEVTRAVVDKLSLNWDDGLFENVTYLYVKKYKIMPSKLNNEIPELVFDMENPFL